jgi:small-conductance mechanosensitive channel
VTHLWTNGRAWLWAAGILGGSIVVALAVHWAVFATGKRLAKQRTSVIGGSLLKHAERPARWILPLLAVVLALPALPVRSDLLDALRHAIGLGLIATVAWVIIFLAEVFSDAVYARYRTDISDNLTARRVRTQITVLRRIFGILVVVVALAAMLMTFPAIHQLGTSLLASAGIVGLVVGMAMKSTLSNLVAGVQIALTEPIRIDDVVIVGSDYGWIEEILTTYVVVRTWDLRRLVVPLSFFIENVFENWTRRTSDLLAYVYLYTDYTVPVEELRKEFRRIVEASALWDKKVCVLQVSDASESTIQIRALTSAVDSSKAWDLRCEVREKLIAFLQERYPEALPKTRAVLRSFRAEFDSEAGPPADAAAFERARQPVPAGLRGGGHDG